MGTVDTDSTKSAKASHLQLVSDDYTPPVVTRVPRLGRWWVLALVGSAALSASGWAWLQQGQIASATFSDLPAGSLPHPGASLAFDAFEHPHHQPGQSRLLHDEDALAADSGLTFTVYNRTGLAAHLVLFAVDAQNNLIWLFPAGTAPAATSVPLAAANVSTIGQPVYLTSARPGHLSVVGMFAPTSFSQQDAQQAFSRGGFAALRSVAGGTTVQVQPLVLQP